MTENDGLCKTCAIVDSCIIKFAGGITKTCSAYKELETDKTRKEAAEREIVAILERLNCQLEMRIACVSIDLKTDKQAFESKVTILLK